MKMTFTNLATKLSIIVAMSIASPLALADPPGLENGRWKASFNNVGKNVDEDAWIEGDLIYDKKSLSLTAKFVSPFTSKPKCEAFSYQVSPGGVVGIDGEAARIIDATTTQAVIWDVGPEFLEGRQAYKIICTK